MTLRKIDFTNSIRADDIQYNFDYLNERMRKERARVGGYGIVDGFEITAINDKRIRISEGTLVDKSGNDIDFKGISLDIAPISYIVQRAAALTVNSQGEVTLPSRPFSSKNNGYFTTSSYQLDYPTQELVIYDAANPTVKTRAIRIDGNIITLDSASWAGKKVTVEYKYARNRMDTVFIHPQKGIEIEQGIFTSSPSHVNINKYDDYFTLGLIEVSIDERVELIIHSEYRTTRSIYVDKDNVLYLNGKEYRDTSIYFSLPESPKEHDLYCDINENLMYAYVRTEQGLEWILVNGVEAVPTVECKIFAPEENPRDLQTFMFTEEELNLHFIPGNNQLQVVIDNAILMSDQFDEISVEGTDKNTGRGFKLKTPLDRATHVEVKILHPVQASPLKNVFQRTATFVDESFDYYTTDNADKVFYTEGTYAVNENQLEVFVDGIKLQRTLDFHELFEGAEALSGDKGLSNAFKIVKAVTTGQMVSYRISKNVYSYDHVQEIIASSQEATDKAFEVADEMKEGLLNLDKIVAEKVNVVNQNLLNLNERVGDLDKFIKKDEVISMDIVPIEVKDNLFRGSFHQMSPSEPAIVINGAKIDDFILAFLVNSKGTQLLIRDVDYTLNGDAGLMIVMRPELVGNGNSVYITGIKIGM